MKRVLIFVRGSDAGGAGIALKTAFDHHGNGWQARMVRRRNTWLDYPADIEWRKNDRKTWYQVRALFGLADIVHIMQFPTIVRMFPYWGRKPTVVQHIGTYYRDNPAAVSEACRLVGAFEVAGSHELQRLAPPGTPVLVGAADLDRMAAIRREVYRPSDRLRIVHAPTRRSTKGTAAFLAACERLARRHPIDVDVIEHVPWQECLARKAQGDILFDQFECGYGANSIEAWGMGLPVVAGLVDAEARLAFAREFGPFPFLEATEATIEAALERLITSPAEREHWGEVGRDFAERVHSQRAVVDQTIRIYEQAIATKVAVAA